MRIGQHRQLYFFHFHGGLASQRVEIVSEGLLALLLLDFVGDLAPNRPEWRNRRRLAVVKLRNVKAEPRAEHIADLADVEIEYDVLEFLDQLPPHDVAEVAAAVGAAAWISFQSFFIRGWLPMSS